MLRSALHTFVAAFTATAVLTGCQKAEPATARPEPATAQTGARPPEPVRPPAAAPAVVRRGVAWPSMASGRPANAVG